MPQHRSNVRSTRLEQKTAKLMQRLLPRSLSHNRSWLIPPQKPNVLVLGVMNEALDAVLDVGHLLQHVIYTNFIKLQTNKLRVLKKKEHDGLDNKFDRVFLALKVTNYC